MTSTIWQHHSHNSCWLHRSINCTVLEISLAFFFFFSPRTGIQPFLFCIKKLVTSLTLLCEIFKRNLSSLRRVR